ncbi:MAG: hypothetical protein ACYTGP_05930 [Planctomycetota bacterium]|jgi:hypothetical protein
MTWKMLVAVVPLLGGCALVGPSSIANGRHAYNEVINRTEDQQILSMLVHERYDETYGLLAVTSITANIKFRADMGAEFGIGSDDAFKGNLVPLSTGVGYEENPTISYVPLGGESFIRRMLMPITLEQAYLLMESGNDQKRWLYELYSSINGLQNPMGDLPAEKFQRLVDVYLPLRRLGVVRLGVAPASTDDQREYTLRFDNYEDHVDDIREALSLLGIEEQTLDGRPFSLPVHLGPGRADDSVYINMRSPFDMIRHAASKVDVPAEHIEAGLAEDVSWKDWGDDPFMRIRSSLKRPRNALIVVPFRGYWFYVDATDTRSKRSFGMLKLLIEMRLEDRSADQQMPVLTVPVG